LELELNLVSPESSKWVVKIVVRGNEVVSSDLTGGEAWEYCQSKLIPNCPIAGIWGLLEWAALT